MKERGEIRKNLSGLIYKLSVCSMQPFLNATGINELTLKLLQQKLWVD